MAGKRWTIEEIKIIQSNYLYAEKEELLLQLPNRTWDSIKLKANSLGLYRSNKFFRKSKLEILLNDTTISYYWLGFILADGHIHDNQRLQISLSAKDKAHLEKLAKYLSIETVRDFTVSLNGKIYPQVVITAQDKEVIPKVTQLLGIKQNKTKQPPNFTQYELSSNKWFALICGFIDGDGNIVKLFDREYFNLRIKCHQSWFNNLCHIEDTLYKIFPTKKNVERITKINKEGYAQLVISNYSILKKMKNLAIELELPILDRKWDQIVCSTAVIP